MQNTPGKQAPPDADSELAELELSDADILDAMQHIPGYLDISTSDFRAIYHLAHRHALDRMLGRITARDLMRTNVAGLSPSLPLDAAAQAMVASGFKALPVVDAEQRVLGMLTENDFLRRMQVDSFLELLLKLMDERFEFKHRCHDTCVEQAMSSPAVTVVQDAEFGEIVSAFRQHSGRSLPVVDAGGRLQGLLLRKDFIHTYNPENLV